MMKVEYRPWIHCKTCPWHRNPTNDKKNCIRECYGGKNPIEAELIECGIGVMGDRSLVRLYDITMSVPTEQLQVKYDTSER